MKIIRWMIGILVGITALVWIGGIYLTRDDLAACHVGPSSRDACQAADAIVAVSGGDTQARTAEAIRLYKGGWGRFIVFSGAAADKTGPSNAEAMRRQAVAEGVPKNVILTEELSETTRQNAMKTGELLRQKNLESVILVTSAYHSRRTSLEFARYIPQIHVRSHPVATDNQWSRTWWLTPSGWQLTIQELVKIVWFTMEK